MELAEQLGISFQAISSWERGETIPDISKLPQLATIFEVSIDDILMNEKGTEMIKNIINDKTKEYVTQNVDSIEEFKQIAPILKLEQTDKIFEILKERLSLDDLASMAPFISQHVINQIAGDAISKLGIKSIHSIMRLEKHGVKGRTGIKACDKSCIGEKDRSGHIEEK